jgi:hypothetical protein
LVMVTVCWNTFLLSLLLCEGFSRFCTLHNSFVKTEIERWKGAEYLMEECATAEGASPWDTSLCTWAMLASTPKAATWVLQVLLLFSNFWHYWVLS